MADSCRILIVEDDKKVIPVYNEQIAFFNGKEGIQLAPTIVQTLDEGLAVLNEMDFDGAIVDLKLAAYPDENGSEVVKEIASKSRFPVRVYTGLIDIDDGLPEESEFFKVYKRTDKTIQDIFCELVAIYRTGITKILGRRGTVEGYLKDIFWSHLAVSFGNWIIEAQTGKVNVEKILLRHTLSHLQEYLDLGDSGDFESYHPAEVYIKRPINGNVHTGLILQKKQDGRFYIVLTPACDLATQKAKKILIARIELKDEVPLVKELHESIEKNSAKLDNASVNEEDKPGIVKKIEKAKSQIESLLDNSHAYKYHYLPDFDGFGGFVNFQDVSSVTPTEILETFVPYATVTGKFCKDIVARFSHYYARQGQPNFDTAKLYEKMFQI